MNRIKKMVSNSLPPILIRSARKSALFRWMKPKAKKLLGLEKLPTWNHVTSGTLKNVWLYFFPQGDWQSMMLNGTYDKELFDFVRNLDLKGKVILDIGSHVGYHALYFSKLVGENGKVIAFEPNPFNAERIKMNLAKNEDIKNVTVREIALSDNDGETEFVFSDDIESGTSSGGFVDSADTLYEKSFYENEVSFRRMKVSTAKLDSLKNVVNDTKKIALMKIDVEGAENLVFSGAINTIKTHKPVIIVEIHSISNMLYFMEMCSNLNYVHKILKKESDGRVLMVAMSK